MFVLTVTGGVESSASKREAVAYPSMVSTDHGRLVDRYQDPASDVARAPRPASAPRGPFVVTGTV